MPEERREWRASELVRDYVYLEDDHRFGWLDAAIIGTDGSIKAIVVYPDVRAELRVLSDRRACGAVDPVLRADLARARHAWYPWAPVDLQPGPEGSPLIETPETD